MPERHIFLVVPLRRHSSYTLAIYPFRFLGNLGHCSLREESELEKFTIRFLSNLVLQLKVCCQNLGASNRTPVHKQTHVEYTIGGVGKEKEG